MHNVRGINKKPDSKLDLDKEMLRYNVEEFYPEYDANEEYEDFETEQDQ